MTGFERLVDAIGWAMRENHYRKVDKFSRIGRLVHWLRRCPTCRFRKKHDAGIDP